MLTCELGSVAWTRVGNPFMCFFCPFQVLWVVATPLLPLEKGQHGRAGSCWCLDHSEHLDRAPSVPSKILPKSLPGPPQRWTQGGSQREAVVLQGKESRGIANAGIPQSNMSWGSCCARRGTEPRVAPPNALLASREEKGRGQGRDPSGGGEVFWGPPSLLLLALTAYK